LEFIGLIINNYSCRVFENCIGDTVSVNHQPQSDRLQENSALTNTEKSKQLFMSEQDYDL